MKFFGAASGLLKKSLIINQDTILDVKNNRLRKTLATEIEHLACSIKDS